MSMFIKFSNYLLNTNDIHKIVIAPNKYYVYVFSKKINGHAYFFGGSGGSHISSYNDEIEVCESKHSTDYKILSDWIDKN
jgi:hypothetical protein